MDLVGIRAGRRQIDLVANNPFRLRFIFSGRRSLVTLGRIDHPQHQVGRVRPRLRAPHALLLDRIVALADAGGVEQGHRIAAEIEMHLDHVARRAGVGRHDRGLAPRQAIEQARLAGIRRARRSQQPGPRAAARRDARRAAFSQSLQSVPAQHEAPEKPGPRAHPPRRKSRCAPRPAPAPRSAAAARPRRGRRARRTAAASPARAAPRSRRTPDRPGPRPRSGRACRSGTRGG